jgi:hypothetical protein
MGMVNAMHITTSDFVNDDDTADHHVHLALPQQIDGRGDHRVDGPQAFRDDVHNPL